MSIQWIVFDLGRVMIRHDRAWVYQRLAQLIGVEFEEVRSFEHLDQELYAPLSTRECSKEELHRIFGNRYSKPLSAEEVWDLVNSELGTTIVESEELLRSLSSRYNVACLSNTCSPHWSWMLEHCAFMQMFHKRFASQLMGCAKPDQMIYQQAQSELGAAPSELLFFDDKVENVEGARRAGWNAEQYLSHDGLLRELKRYGIEI